MMIEVNKKEKKKGWGQIKGIMNEVNRKEHEKVTVK